MGPRMAPPRVRSADRAASSREAARRDVPGGRSHRRAQVRPAVLAEGDARAVVRSAAWALLRPLGRSGALDGGRDASRHEALAAGPAEGDAGPVLGPAARALRALPDRRGGDRVRCCRWLCGGGRGRVRLGLAGRRSGPLVRPHVRRRFCVSGWSGPLVLGDGLGRWIWCRLRIRLWPGRHLGGRRPRGRFLGSGCVGRLVGLGARRLRLRSGGLLGTARRGDMVVGRGGAARRRSRLKLLGRLLSVRLGPVHRLLAIAVVLHLEPPLRPLGIGS